MAATAKEAGELDDPDVQEAREALEAAGLNPDEGSFYTGVIFGQTPEQLFREAAQFVRYIPPAEGEELGQYEPISDVLSLEGDTGAFSG